MSLAQNLAAGEAALAQIRTYGIVSSNKISHRLKAAGGADAVIDAAPAARQALLGTASAGVGVVRTTPVPAALGRRGQLGTIARTAISNKAGNCGELAIIASIIMVQAGTTPVHMMRFTAPGYDHCWAVAGLAATWQADNMRTWGSEAVWVDPWQHDTGVCFSISDLVAGKVQNLNAIFKCNSATLIEQGVPVAEQM